MSISKQVIPNGGWRFTQESTRTTFVALDFKGLVSAVVDHRKANGMKDCHEELVEIDVEDQIEKFHPELSIN